MERETWRGVIVWSLRKEGASSPTRSQLEESPEPPHGPVTTFDPLGTRSNSKFRYCVSERVSRTSI